MRNHLSTVFFGPKNIDAFCAGIQGAIDQVPPSGIYVGDNLFTFGRNLSFLDDEAFMAAVERHTETAIEKAVIWRTYVLCWAAKRALRLDGDFVECGCYKGVSARIVCDYVRFGSTGRHFWLYDLFEHADGMAHHSMPEHSGDLFEAVQARFIELENVSVIKGRVPESFAQGMPEKVAFLHVDMNNAAAEAGALEVLFDRITPGAVVVFDDYGWTGYRAQKLAEDRFFAARGLQILELPTGQGLVVV